MKKYILLTIIAMTGLMISSPVTAAASEKGRMSLGLNGGYATYNNSGYVSVDFQYSFANHVRISPSFGYAFRNEGKSAFILNADMHFPFRVARGFSLYPLAGATLQNWNYTGRSNRTRFGGNFGGGMELAITSYLKVSLEAKYALMDDTSGGFFGLGISYVF